MLKYGIETLNCLITEVRFDDRKTVRHGNRDSQGISNMEITHAPMS